VSRPEPQDEEPEDRLQAAVESIGGHARSVNLERADRLSEALTEVADGHLDQDRRRAAADIAHQLVGSAGTFGFGRASQLAGEIERFFREADLTDPVPLETARDQVRRLREELSAGPDYQPDEDRGPTS
jgi:HPt (histidine-containing phosphotransfer) domain-containing protein